MAGVFRGIEKLIVVSYPTLNELVEHLLEHDILIATDAYYFKKKAREYNDLLNIYQQNPVENIKSFNKLFYSCFVINYQIMNTLFVINGDISGLKNKKKSACMYFIELIMHKFNNRFMNRFIVSTYGELDYNEFFAIEHLEKSFKVFLHYYENSYYCIYCNGCLISDYPVINKVVNKCCWMMRNVENYYIKKLIEEEHNDLVEYVAWSNKVMRNYLLYKLRDFDYSYYDKCYGDWMKGVINIVNYSGNCEFEEINNDCDVFNKDAKYIKSLFKGSIVIKFEDEYINVKLCLI